MATIFRKYPSASGADPEAVAVALVSPAPSPHQEVYEEQFEGVVQALDKAEGSERDILKRRLFQLAGLPHNT